MDGASSAMGASAGIVIITPEGIRLEHSFRLGFKAPNNEAEYEAFIARLRTAFDMGAQDIEVYSDSWLAANQVKSSFKARDYQMNEYLKVVKQVMGKFCTTNVIQITRGRNRHANSLATVASAMTEDIPRLIKVELVTELSINTTAEDAIRIDMAAITITGSCWMDPIIEFLAENRVSDDESEANKVCRVASRYWPSADRKLYRRSFGGLYLLCLHRRKVNELLTELHERVCGSHVRGRSLTNRAMIQGFWWPKMRNDAVEYVRKCERCQKHAHLIHQLAGHLNPISSPWPFAQWGLDILGPFPRANGNRRFVLVAVDYFTKWAEVEALANIRDVDVKKFVWKNIITRFGVSDTIIFDNGLQFDSRAFRDFCRDLGITNRYSTPAYP